MSRKEELDAMDLDAKKADIMKALETQANITFDSKPQMAFWGDAINALIDDGKIEGEWYESWEQQYSCYKVTKV